MIDVSDIHFRYPDTGSEDHFRAPDTLGGISLTLAPGEKVAMMGANGSGKTTLAQCLNGLIVPDSGKVLVDGLSTADQAHRLEIRRRVGMVFQNPDNQIVATSVEREIAFGLENLGVEWNEMRERVDQTLAMFHLDPKRACPPHLLSGGERQRLAVASVWVMRPDYLVLDEPTSLLDPRGRGEILRFLDLPEVRQRMGVLLITQYPDEAMACPRLIVLDRGKKVWDDDPLRVFRHIRELEEIGIGVPVKVELESEIDRIRHGNPD
jgi:energy-coupling factor transport system ATP-binding protein